MRPTVLLLARTSGYMRLLISRHRRLVTRFLAHYFPSPSSPVTLPTFALRLFGTVSHFLIHLAFVIVTVLRMPMMRRANSLALLPRYPLYFLSRVLTVCLGVFRRVYLGQLNSVLKHSDVQPTPPHFPARARHSGESHPSRGFRGLWWRAWHEFGRPRAGSRHCAEREGSCALGDYHED